MPLSLDEFVKKRREEQSTTPLQPQSTEAEAYMGRQPANQYKAWRDWKGNVNLSNLTTGQTDRYYQAYNHIGGADSNKEVGKDVLFSDIGQSIGGALQRQGANYKSAGATLLLGAADLLNGKKEFKPEVGSWLWRLQEGSEADTGVANKLMEDSKAGRGKVGQLVMDLTTGAVDLASDALLTAATGGATIGGKLAITAGLGAMGARSFGGGAEEAREQGKSIGQQFLTGAKSATIEMLTEKIGGPFEKAYGASALGKATSNLAERLGKNAGMKFVLNRLGDFAGEASEEMLSDVLNPLADKLLKLDNGEGWKNLWTADGLSQMAYDGLVGGLLGLAGGVAEGLSPGQREALIDRGIDNAMEANRNGRSIANEMEQDIDGRVASAIANSSSQEADSELPFTMGSQEAAEAKSEATPTETPPIDQSTVKQEAGEFNAESAPDVTTPAEFTALDEAIDRGEMEEPTPSEDAFVEEPMAEQAQAKAKPIGKKTAERMAGAAYLADIAKQRAENADQAGAGVDTEGWEDTNIDPALWNDRKTIERALAQNGVDYNYDPREALWDSETGQYREVDLDLLDEEERNQFLADMKQARLLDAVDNWLDKNYRKIINSKKPGYTVANARAEFQSKLNDFVRWYLANDVDNGRFALGLGEADNREKHSRSKEAGDTLREIAEDKAAEARLKGKKRTKTHSKNGFDVTAIGEATYRVVGPGGRESVQVANGIDEAIQKHTDEGSEFAKKAAEQRKTKEAELEEMRKEVIESGENPAQVEGSDGNTYEVTKQFSNEQQTRYEYAITELDEDGLPSDREARVFQNRASTNEEAVQYAIDNDLFKADDYSDLTEGSNDGREDTSSELGRSDEVRFAKMQGRENTDGKTTNAGRDLPNGRVRAADESAEQSSSVSEKVSPEEFVERANSFLDDNERASKYEYYTPGESTEADRAYAQAKALGMGNFFVVKSEKGKKSDNFKYGRIAYTKANGATYFNLTNAIEAEKKWGRFGVSVNSLIVHEDFHRRLAKTFNRIISPGVVLNSKVERGKFCLKACEAAFRGLPDNMLQNALSSYAEIYGVNAADSFDAHKEAGLVKDSDWESFRDGYYAEELLCDLLGKNGFYLKLEASDKLLLRLNKSAFGAVSSLYSDLLPSVNQNDDGNEKRFAIISGEENSGEEVAQPKGKAPPSDLEETLNEMSRDKASKESAEDAEFEALRAQDKAQTNAKEYAYQKNLEAEQNSEEAKEQAQSDEEKAKSTFGKDYEKVQKSVDDFDGIKTRFDDEAFQKSNKGRDRSTRGKLKKLREAFRNAATTGDVETLFSIYEDLQTDINLANFYNEEIQEDINNWRKLSDPNLDSYNEGAVPYAAARTMQKMAHKFKLANEYQQTLQKMNETLRGSRNGVLRKIGKSERLTASVARALMRWQVNPDTVFKMIDAFDKGNAGEGYKLAKELQTAHREKYRILREARSMFDKASELDGYEDFAFGKQKVKDYSGREWDMRSALSVVKAIDTIRSTSGKKLGGTDGFGVMDSNGNIEFIDMKDVDAIKLYESLKSGLSDVAIKYGDIATEAFGSVKEPLRAKYKQNNGVDISMIGDEDSDISEKDVGEKAKKRIGKAVYSPLSYVDRNGNVYQFDIAKQETYNNIPRFLRERSDAGGTYILIKPYTEVTGKYFEQVSNYLAYSTFNEKMRGLGKGSSYETGLGNTLAEVFGKDMGNWYKSYVEDLATYQNEDDVEGVNSLLRQGRQQLQQGALLGSVSVPMKQISSYWAASGILHPDSLIKNYRVKLFKPKNSSDAAVMLASRAMGNLEQSAAEAAKDAEKWLGKLKYSSKFVKFMANAINQMDYNTVSNLLSATEYDVLKYQFNGDESVIGTDEYKAAVEEKFQDVVDRSQPNFDKQMRAEYGRTDNEIVRMLSMFRTQQTQNLNLLATAIGEYQASRGTENQAKAAETLKQTIAGQAASAFSLSMLTILADMLLHRQKKYEDEEKELDASKILTRLGINAIEASSGTLWFGDTIAKWAIDRISGGKTKEFYGVNMGVISTVSDILENFENFTKNPSRSNARYCAGNIATLMGIPLNNAYSMLNSAIMYSKDVLGSNEGDYDDILKYLDAQAKAAKKEEEKAAKEAAKAAEKSGADMLADTAKKNTSQSELNSQGEQKTSEVGRYLTKPYTALVEAGMSPQSSKDFLGEIDADGNNSVKQAEMIAYYKAHPEDEQYVEAMWNSYGYKTSWEKAKKKAG